MEIPHRDLATAQAARLVLNNLAKHLFCRSTTRKQLIEALIPVFGIRWDVRVLRRIGTKRLLELLCALRNSAVPRPEYDRISELWKAGLANETTFPVAWEPWRALIERFNLDDELPLSAWLIIVDTCIKQGWGEPTHLAKADYSSFTAVAHSHSFDPLAHQLWKAAVLVFAGNSAGEILNLRGASADAESLLRQLRLANRATLAVTRDVNSSLAKLRMPKSFKLLGPAAKLAKLREASVNTHKVKCFFRVASQQHALTGVRFCFASFASAIRCYFSFCELRGGPSFPGA